MKPKTYLEIITDSDGYTVTPFVRWFLNKNPRDTAREEAIAADVLRQANPRENISGNYPWGPEEKSVLRQLWINPNANPWAVWRDVPHDKAFSDLYSVEKTPAGDDLPVPNAIKEPGTIKGDFMDKIKEALGETDEKS